MRLLVHADEAKCSGSTTTLASSRTGVAADTLADTLTMCAAEPDACRFRRLAAVQITLRRGGLARPARVLAGTVPRALCVLPSGPPVVYEFGVRRRPSSVCQRSRLSSVTGWLPLLALLAATDRALQVGCCACDGRLTGSRVPLSAGHAAGRSSSAGAAAVWRWQVGGGRCRRAKEPAWTLLGRRAARARALVGQLPLRVAVSWSVRHVASARHNSLGCAGTT